ncbi:MAG: proline dehydrogenase [Polyangiaceae bacterium]|nr:proline dehydrogenase [Polyangiaceae bacterium]
MSPEARIRALVQAAQRLKDPTDALGRAARAELPESTGLSPESVELALREILETPSDAEITALARSVAPAPRAWVQLAANVFTAPLRAIALALGQSDQVRVRASRREPVFPRLLHAASGQFELAAELDALPGDHLWAYGSDETLGQMLRKVPPGVVIHAHGSGFGLALVEGAAPGAAAALVRDIVPFDQRGCLSPRVAVVVGTRDDARAFARAVAQALEAAGAAVPLGRLDGAELAESVRLRDTMSYAGEVLAAGAGWVALDDAEQRLVTAPGARTLVVVRSDRGLDWLAGYAREITCVGVSAALAHPAKALFPGARRCALGAMQRPPFDGPVDLRPASKSRVVGEDPG